MPRHLFALLIATAGLLFAGPPIAAADDDADQARPTKIACIGDSITFGAAIKNRSKNCYPAQLDRMLGKAVTVKNFGVNAATLLKKGNKPYWKLKQFKAAQDYQPDIVVIKLGTNDTKPGNWQHKKQYMPDHIEMITTFQELESKPKVFICYPAPVVGERWGISDKTVREEVIPLIEKIADATKVRVIDLYTPLKDKPELMPDKVHPNAKGATILARTVAKTLGETLFPVEEGAKPVRPEAAE